MRSQAALTRSDQASHKTALKGICYVYLDL